MNLEKAKLLKAKLAALKTFIRNVAKIGNSLGDITTCEAYQKMYKDIKETLNDADLETYAPGIPYWMSSGSGGLLWQMHQAEIVNSGTMLISYLEAVLAPTSSESRQFTKNTIPPANIFISHGRESKALDLLNNFIRAIGLIPVIVMEQPSQGMSLDDKVIALMQTCASAIIFATGDDKVEENEHLQPRQNVIHEIGLAQQVLTNRITYLLEEGTEFPSNIAPKVYERFTNNNLSKVFIAIVRDLRAFGILQ
ncbi:MAG: TIR domain-containing protein [Halobacteriota archaeon]